MRYTGHPLFDVGLATLVVMAGKEGPGDLGDVDFDLAAEYIAAHYTRQPLQSYLTSAFPNSGFVNPAYNTDQRRQYAALVGQYASENAEDEQRCFFTGEAVSAVAWSLKEGLAAGRAFRQHIPMITGEGVINFSARGVAGLPVSGRAMLCLQLVPLGSVKCGGKMLAVHSDNPLILQHFARRAFRASASALLIAEAAGETKMPESQHSHYTTLIGSMLDADTEIHDAIMGGEVSSVTAYHFSNSGQSNAFDKYPPLSIYHMRVGLLRFLARLQSRSYRAAWAEFVRRGWQVAPKKRKADGPWEPRSNSVYDYLLGLPQTSDRLVKRLTTLARHQARTGGEYEVWSLVELFAEEVVSMAHGRIEAIRSMGDALAEYVQSADDSKFFRGFTREDRPAHFRALLRRANIGSIKAGMSPLFDLDAYVMTFHPDLFEQDEAGSRDWYLTRDLVSIRMTERLFAAGFFAGKSADSLGLDEKETTQS